MLSLFLIIAYKLLAIQHKTLIHFIYRNNTEVYLLVVQDDPCLLYLLFVQVILYLLSCPDLAPPERIQHRMNLLTLVYYGYYMKYNATM